MYEICALLVYLLIYSMEQSSFEKLPGSQLVKKFPAFYGTRRFSYITQRRMVIPYRRFGTAYRSHLQWSVSPWSRVLLEKLPGSQLVKKFPAFYGNRRFSYITQRRMVIPYRRSGTAYRSHLQWSVSPGRFLGLIPDTSVLY